MTLLDQSWMRALANTIRLLLITSFVATAYPARAQSNNREKLMDSGKKEELASATFGGGCFWCVEAVFENMKGVKSVISGYAGGRTPKPNYEQVCSGRTGHAEVCQIQYDPKQVNFVELMEVFFATHDPTTLNQQGNDFGTQYRSSIMYENDEQKELAEKYVSKLNESGAFAPRKVVTEVVKLKTFYPAEEYHQDFYAKNPTHGYCVRFAQPKIDKFKKVFADKYKEKR